MPRRASGKRKWGKSARRARAGLVGEKTTKLSFTGQHAAKEEKRYDKAEERKELQKLQEVNHFTDTSDKIPHSFILARGKVGKYVLKLVRDLRTVMKPYTASNLKVMKRNNIKDFVTNAIPLGVTHLFVLTKSELSVTLRIIRNPHGPTLTFNVLKYTLEKDVISSQKHPASQQNNGQHSQPLLVMKNFNDKARNQLQLMQTTFRNMFPAINVDTVIGFPQHKWARGIILVGIRSLKLNLTQIRRCIVFNYNNESDTVDFRHYRIKTIPTGISKSTKKLVQNRVPNLSKYTDISDYFLNPGQQSETEAEKDEDQVKLEQDLAQKGCEKGQKVSIRLIELGPRLTLKLLKIQEGIDEGEVLYHSYIRKSTQELIKQRKQAPQNKKAKERRIKQEEHRIIRRLKTVADEKDYKEWKIREESEEMKEKQRGIRPGDEQEDNAEEEVEEKGRKRSKTSCQLGRKKRRSANK